MKSSINLLPCLNGIILPPLCIGFSLDCRWIFCPGYFISGITQKIVSTHGVNTQHSSTLYSTLVLESCRTTQLAPSVSSYLLFLQACLGEKLPFARIIGKLMLPLLCPLEKKAVWESTYWREMVRCIFSLHLQRWQQIHKDVSCCYFKGVSVTDVHKVLYCLNTVLLSSACSLQRRGWMY